MTKRQRSGFFVIATLIILLEIVIQYYPSWTRTEASIKFTPTEEALLLKYASEDLGDLTNAKVPSKPLSLFNPNALDEEGFIDIGFSRKQAKSIIKYRYIVGGNFSSIEEFGESYVISNKKLEQLRPYIRLKNVAKNNANNTTHRQYSSKSIKPKGNLKPFYPNKLNHSQWAEKGFSERQAQVILNFKNSLPDRKFTSLEQIHMCYAINDYMFNRIKPFIRFDTVESAPVAIDNNDTDKPSTWNVNEMTQKDLILLGFTEEQAIGILKYKAFKGSFNNITDFKSCTFVTSEDVKRIENQLLFE